MRLYLRLDCVELFSVICGHKVHKWDLYDSLYTKPRNKMLYLYYYK